MSAGARGPKPRAWARESVRREWYREYRLLEEF